jgi:hypothetical protein
MAHIVTAIAQTPLLAQTKNEEAFVQLVSKTTLSPDLDARVREDFHVYRVNEAKKPQRLVLKTPYFRGYVKIRITRKEKTTMLFADTTLIEPPTQEKLDQGLSPFIFMQLNIEYNREIKVDVQVVHLDIGIGNHSSPGIPITTEMNETYRLIEKQDGTLTYELIKP